MDKSCQTLAAIRKENENMKKFITTSPFQQKMECQVYEAVENEKLQMEKATRFPVIALLNAYVQKGEEVELLVIKHEYENAKKNYVLLCEEVQELEKEKEFTCKITPISVEYNERIEEHLTLFEHLIEHIEDGDELYACMTYGSKAIPMVQMMALNFAYRAKANTHIGCIVYGKFDFNAKKAEIYDMTSLFYMDEIVRKVSDMKVKEPLNIIKQILDLGSEDEGNNIK
jgi:hypothetical protein